MLLNKVIMTAALYYFTVLKHHYGVRIAYRGQTVSYHKGGSAVHKLIHTLFYKMLGTCIYGACSLVKHEHGRVCHSRSRNRYELSLPLTQVCAVACYNRVVTVGKSCYKRIGIGELSGFYNLFVSCVKLAVAYIVFDCTRKQVCILKHHESEERRSPLQIFCIFIPS